MTIYCLFEKKNRLKEIESFYIQDIGFSKAALIFTFIWGFSKKLYIVSGAWFFLLVSVFFLMQMNIISLNILILLIFINAVFWGFLGNAFLIDNLIEKYKYKPVELINSSSSYNALLATLSKR